ncbi:MAG: helix-turn-helix domain-containing protein [Flavobacteriaceae bacterium]
MMTFFRRIFFFFLIFSTHSKEVYAITASDIGFDKITGVLINANTALLQENYISNQDVIKLSRTLNEEQVTESVVNESDIIEYIDEAAKYLDAFEFKKSLKTALMAYKLAKEEENSVLEVNSLLLVAQINMYWSNTETSLLIYEKIEAYRKKLSENLPQNLDLILDLGKSSVYLKSNNPNKALELIEQVFTNHQNIHQTFFYQDFLWNSGIAYFQKEEYQKAFDSLNKVVAMVPSNYYEALLNYYTGKFYEQTKDVNSALPFYMKLDTLITGQKEIFPETKEIYGTINNYFLEKGDRVRQFDYLNKFLKTLTIHNDISDYVKNTTREQFEIPLLIEEKQLEIEKLKNQEIKNKRDTILIISVLLLGLFTSIYYVVKQRKYKKRFDKLITKDFKKSISSDEENIQPNISIEVVEDLLNKLNLFESKKEFLANEVSLNEVSKQFQTNSSYLSKVVNLKKDKNFSNYINDLRIEHCLEQLDKEPRLRKYTIKALAEEMGFNNAQSFSTAFFKYTGIHPSFFIEQLKKSKKE